MRSYTIELIYFISIIAILIYHSYTDLKDTKIKNSANALLLLIQLVFLTYKMTTESYPICFLILIVTLFIIIGLNTVLDYSIILKKINRLELEDSIDKILTITMFLLIPVTLYILYKYNINYLSYSYIVNPLIILAMTIALVKYTNSFGAGDGKLLMILGINMSYVHFISFYFIAVIIQLVLMVLKVFAIIRKKEKTNIRKLKLPFAVSIFISYLIYVIYSIV